MGGEEKRLGSPASTHTLSQCHIYNMGKKRPNWFSDTPETTQPTPRKKPAPFVYRLQIQENTPPPPT